tara:strand:+ start:682 stop:966 length:285 start_codon:yes stop_codon:yes gene_type:complete
MTKFILAASAATLLLSLPAGATQEAGRTLQFNEARIVEKLKSFSNVGEFKIAAMCTSAGEQLSGAIKTCFYSCATGTKAVTVSAGSLCPLSIDG